MAENKKGFLLYCDQQSLFKELSDDEAGKLIKHIFAYVNDEGPEDFEDRVLKISFAPIKQQLKRDLKKYEKLREFRSEIGKKGGLAKASKAKQSLANVPVIDNDTVTDTVTVKDNVKESVIKNQLTQWFKDLPNSMDLEDIARMTNSTKELLTPRVEEFKKYCEQEYPTYNKFLFHFKRWLLKNPPQQVKKSKALLG